MGRHANTLTAINGIIAHRKELRHRLDMYHSGQLTMGQDELLALHAQLQEYKQLADSVRAGFERQESHGN